MNGTELKIWMAVNRYSNGELARALGVRLQEISRWRNDHASIKLHVELALQWLALKRIEEAEEAEDRSTWFLVTAP